MAQAQIVQATGNRHHEIPDPVLPVTYFVLDDATTLHTGHRVLDPHFLACYAAVLGFLVSGEFAATWFLRWLSHLDTRDRKSLEAHVLVQHAARG